MWLSRIFRSTTISSKSTSTDDIEIVAYVEPYDFQGVPTAACPACGSEWFNVPVKFDKETYDIETWGLEGSCYNCETLVTVVCPVDAEERNFYA